MVTSAQFRARLALKYNQWLHVVTVLTCVLIILMWGSLPPVVIYFATKDHAVNISAFPAFMGSSVFNTTNVNQIFLRECNENFYRDDTTGLCIPDCYTWNSNEAGNIMLLVSALGGLLISVVIFIISCLRAKTVLTFPSVLVVYMTISISCRALLSVISFNQTHLFCYSKNYFNNFMEITPFCAVTGMLHSYGLLQLSVWGLCHAAALFWRIRFPFHARSFTLNKKDKYLHLICLIAGLVLPLVAVIAPIMDTVIHFSSSNSTSLASSGFGFGRTFGLNTCFGSTKVALNSFLIPTAFIVPLTATLFILVCYYIHKQYILVKFARSERFFKVTSMEVKVLIILSYYIGLYVIYTAVSIVANKYIIGYLQDFIGYVICKQSTTACDDEVLHHPILNAFAVLTLVLNVSSAIHLVYVLNFQEMRAKFAAWRSKYVTGQTGSSKLAKQQPAVARRHQIDM